MIDYQPMLLELTKSAVTGMLAAETEDWYYQAVYRIEKTGEETSNPKSQQLKGDGTVDWGEPAVENPLVRSREEEIARQAVKIAVACIHEIQSVP